MKQIFTFAVLILILTTTTETQGQITTGDLYRESSAAISDYLPPYAGLSEGENSLSSGIFETHPSVYWEDGHCQAHQTTEITSDGQIINISGTLQADMGRFIPGDVNVFDSHSLIFVDFMSDGPFVISGELGSQGSHYETTIHVLDEGTMIPIYDSGTNPPPGSFSAVCSGTGPYKLEIIHYFLVHQGDTGGNESGLSFDISLVPEGTVATTNECWGSVKALYK